MKRRSTLLLCTLLLSGCALTSSDDNSPILQTFLFELEHRNHAWGHAWYGFHVDKQGAVHTYLLDADAVWEPAHRDAFTEQELREKFSHAKKRVATIDQATLAEQVALIRLAAEGTLDDPVDRCRDAGTTTFRAFLYDERTARYTPVLLRQEGDFAQKNRSAGADALTTWLRTLDERFSDSFCAP